MLLEALAGGVVGLVVLWLLFEPLLSPHAVGPKFIEPEDPDDTPRGQALLALKEIDFDRATGKLSDEDYADLKARYTTQALDLLKEEEAEAVAESVPPGADSVERLIAARVRTLTNAAETPECTVCGPRPEVDAVFCSGCGQVLHHESATAR